MGAQTNTTYKNPNMEFTNSSSHNITGLLGGINGFVPGTDTACSSEEFIVRHVITPAVEATLKSYLQYCLPESAKFLTSDLWLCLPDHSFNCDYINNYTDQVKRRHGGIPIPTMSPNIPQQAHLLDGTTLMIAIVALLVGTLIGVIITAVVCLCCPGTYRWASKTMGRTVIIASGKRQQSVVSDYYAAIEVTHNNQSINLKPTPRGQLVTATNEHYTGVHTDSDDVTLSDSGIQVETRAPASSSESASPQLAKHESCDYENFSDVAYEQLGRHRLHHQSHNYDCLTPTSPLSPTDSEHSYFVLEKSK